MPACEAVTIPATDGVDDELCMAPCAGEFCAKHLYLDVLADYAPEEVEGYADYVGDPDNAFDIERERDWELA